jgi:hypothetical protein
MDNNIIMPLLNGLQIPSRLINIISWYLLSLMMTAEKHTQKFATKISGKTNSLFSKLLIRHLGLSKLVLNRAARRRLKKLLKKRFPLVKNAPWTIAIIIDSTLHSRSSKYIENAQKFNHGKGWLTGHQWTNIGILIAGQYVPLPPIPFYTKSECKKRGIKYKTEHDKIISFLKTLSLTNILGVHEKSEIVFIMDAGYDCRKLQRAILKRGWDFVAAIKKDSTILKTKKEWIQISTFFKDGRRPWKAIRIKTNGGKKKWQKYTIKQLEGYLKGVKRVSKLVCSKKSNRKEKFFACSNVNVDIRIIIATYLKRWAVELFHRAVKSNLGFEDAGVEKFDTLHAHIHWVYCAYIFLHDLIEGEGIGVKDKQIILEAKIEATKIKRIIQKVTQFNGQEKVKGYCFQVINNIESLYGKL